MRDNILDTVGIEFESIGLNISEATMCIAKSGMDSYLRLDRDASVESSSGLIPNSDIKTNLHSVGVREIRDLLQDRATMGYEIKTIPIMIPTVEKVVWKFLSQLRCYGDFENKRASTHIHVGFAGSTKILVNLMKFGIKLDPLLFRMAGMGRQFRGEYNNSTYCRPLVLGPVVSGADGLKYRLLNPTSAVHSDESTTFWKHYAINPRDDGGVHRYHPGRYFALNLYAIPLHGTLEYRHFNQILDPLLLISTVKLVRALTELIFYISSKEIEELPEIDLFKEYKNQVYMEFLVNLIDKIREFDLDYCPTNKEIDALMMNIENTPHHKIINENVKTHVRDYHLPPIYIRTGFFERITGRTRNPDFVDIHNIGEFSILD